MNLINFAWKGKKKKVKHMLPLPSMAVEKYLYWIHRREYTLGKVKLKIYI